MEAIIHHMLLFLLPVEGRVLWELPGEDKFKGKAFPTVPPATEIFLPTKRLLWLAEEIQHLKKLYRLPNMPVR